MIECTRCLKPTSNLKFCSRSCAVAYNNACSPKRVRTSPVCRRCKITPTEGVPRVCDNCRVRSQAYSVEQFGLEWESGRHDGSAGKYGFASRLLKRWLVMSRGEKCEICGWCEVNPTSRRVPIEMEHIDGDRTNNRVGNVILLCPNHHSLTATWKSLNRR